MSPESRRLAGALLVILPTVVIFLVLSLVALRYVDDTELGAGLKWLVRLAIASAAILVPAAFFLSVLSPYATEPNGLIALAYIGAAVLATGVID